MKTTKNTILITGSSAGIGFEMAKLLTEAGNHVIITGRDGKRLAEAADQLKNVTAIQCDVSNEHDMDELVKSVLKDFPELNMLINNAGRAEVYNLLTEGINACDKAKIEMQTNFFPIVRLIEKLLPHLRQQADAAIVNTSSVLAFVPGRLVTYSASKAALHSYTQSLRMLLEEASTVKVFELMPPLVNTSLTKDIGGANGVHPSVVAEGLLNGLKNDEFEIHIGQTADFYKIFLSSPQEAVKRMFGARAKIK